MANARLSPIFSPFFICQILVFSVLGFGLYSTFKAKPAFAESKSITVAVISQKDVTANKSDLRSFTSNRSVIELTKFVENSASQDHFIMVTALQELTTDCVEHNRCKTMIVAGLMQDISLGRSQMMPMKYLIETCRLRKGMTVQIETDTVKEPVVSCD